MLHIRINDEAKAQGNAVLDAIGLSASDAIRLLYSRLIADQAFPLELKVPNAETKAAMAEAHAMLRERRAYFEYAGSLSADPEADRL
jgi:DNA-damage-inducible protein J